MAENKGFEQLLGSVSAPGVGPTIVVGAGGTMTELLGDTVAALAPGTPDYAAQMLYQLRIAKLFGGFRGAPPVDVAAVARAVASFSRVLIEYEGIAEAEINPLLVAGEHVVAVDARPVAM